MAVQCSTVTANVQIRGKYSEIFKEDKNGEIETTLRKSREKWNERQQAATFALWVVTAKTMQQTVIIV